MTHTGEAPYRLDSFDRGCSRRLYGKILRVNAAIPDWDGGTLILSKGHAAAGLYATLAETGFFPWNGSGPTIRRISAMRSRLTPCATGDRRSSGSLGHGLSIAAGWPGCQERWTSWRAFALLSDGECDEGFHLEPALFARTMSGQSCRHRGLQQDQSLGKVKDTLDLEPFADKWQAFGWAVRSGRP